ncbi:MAG: hypothetical protein E7451_03415 [Ruminococcaceae bacterium]|nr:hypothetical protein [Oscillospiraceae bacterium]
MFQKNGDFSQSDLSRMLRQPEAQALLARLQQLDQAALQNAVDRAFRGDTAGAKDALSPLLQDSEVQRLSQRMRDGNGGI